MSIFVCEHKLSFFLGQTLRDQSAQSFGKHIRTSLRVLLFLNIYSDVSLDGVIDWGFSWVSLATISSEVSQDIIGKRNSQVI